MNLQQTNSSQPPNQSKPLASEELLAQRIAEEQVATAKQFGVPLWILRHPGSRIEVEDDDVAFQEGT
jgi:hypothetical protein